MTIKLNRVLVPVDFSPTSDKAFDYAVEFARVFGAEILAAHIVEDPILYAPTTDPVYRADFEQMVQQKLDSLAEHRDCEGISIRTMIQSGTPFYEIIQLAGTEDCELIVMGTHGHGPLQHVLMGSVAEKVVRKAKCPVLVVRPDQHQFVRP
ncbi:MAG: universal stress protein [Planctomycetota bacterium]